MNDDVQAFKTARERLGWTQREAAAALGVTQAAVWNWEAGRRHLPAVQLAALQQLAAEAAAEQAADPLALAHREIERLRAALDKAAAGEKDGAQAWRARAEAAEQRADRLAAELESTTKQRAVLRAAHDALANEKNKWKQHATQQADAARILEMSKQAWEKRARDAEKKIELMEAGKAAAAEQARKAWEAFKQAGKPTAPTHPYSAADLRDLAELELDELATWEAIKQAGKAAAARHHPDMGGNKEDFTRTRAAFERLKARHEPKQRGTA
jgi:DNA-binding XRE family transcriptional regulator